MRKTLIATVLLTGITTLGTVPAAAEETTCTGTIGAITVDNVLVPAGATCTLDGTTVQGTINVATNAVLKASAVSVVGNVQGEGARSVQVLAGSEVGGDVQVVQGRGARIADSTIGGSILFDTDRTRVTAARNDVGGDVQAFANTGGVVISRNSIDGNLQCKENTPAPTGGGNIVGGSKEDQCAAL